MRIRILLHASLQQAHERIRIGPMSTSRQDSRRSHREEFLVVARVNAIASAQSRIGSDDCKVVSSDCYDRSKIIRQNYKNLFVIVGKRLKLQLRFSHPPLLSYGLKWCWTAPGTWYSGKWFEWSIAELLIYFIFAKDWILIFVNKLGSFTNVVTEKRS